MNEDIQQYINSGALEAYITGGATPDEEHEIKHLQAQYPEVKYALQQLETDFEHMAKLMAITPPPIVWNKIEGEINGLITRDKTQPQTFNEGSGNGYTRQSNRQQYIEIEAENQRMNIHKTGNGFF